MENSQLDTTLKKNWEYYGENICYTVGKPPTLKTSDHWSRGKREVIIKTVVASQSFCKRSRGRISNTKISNILIKLIIIFIVTLLMNMCLV